MERSKARVVESLSLTQKITILNFMLQEDIKNFHSSYSADGLMPRTALRYLVEVDTTAKPQDIEDIVMAMQFVHNSWCVWDRHDIKESTPKDGRGTPLLDFETTVEFLFDRVTGVHKFSKSAKWQGLQLRAPIDWNEFIRNLDGGNEVLEETQASLANALQNCAHLQAQLDSLLSKNNHDGDDEEEGNNKKNGSKKGLIHSSLNLTALNQTEIIVFYEIGFNETPLKQVADKLGKSADEIQAIFRNAGLKLKLFLEDNIQNNWVKRKS